MLSPTELHVTVIVAGYETSYGGSLNVCGPSVWAHQGGLSGAAPKLDGTVVDRNGGTMFGEYMCTPTDAPGHMSTIGIMAHEIGHDIGFPDLYDTDYSSSGIGGWSLMSGGSWNSVGTAQPGTTPAGLDAFSKSYQGWITPTPVVGALTGAALPAAATSPTAYRLGDNRNGVDWKFETHRGKGEYFLVENRQPVGFDAGLPACGVIVYHVDERVTSTNEANADDTHRLVDVVEADGTTPMDGYPYEGSAADVFPGSSGHVDFSDATLPPATLYSGHPSGAAMHVDGGCADDDERQPLHAAPQRRLRVRYRPDRHARLGHGSQQRRHQGGRRAGRRGQPGRRVDLVPLPGAGHRHAAADDVGLGLRHAPRGLPRQRGHRADRGRQQRQRHPDHALQRAWRRRSGGESPTASPSTGRTSAPARARARRC